MSQKPRDAGHSVFRIVLPRMVFAAFGVLAWAGIAPAQQTPPIPPAPVQAQPAPSQPAVAQPSGSPICVRLQGQLAAFDQGTADPGRADQIKQSEDAIAKQQADLDHAIEKAHKAGCAGTGFLALFSALSPSCGPITSQIQQMRGNLDRMISDLEQLKSGSNDRQDQRRALIGQLAQNNCGAQYTAAANSQGGPQGFFDALFGGGKIVNGNGDGAPSGTFRTVCVRTCDGFYFPISYSTSPVRFPDDERTCQRLCPASEVALYSYRNPGEDMEQAQSISGQPYTALPNAFRYRKEFTPACSCRKAGQSWADALKDADDSTTLESGDIVVTDQNAKALSQPPKPYGKAAGAAAASLPAPTKPAATTTAAVAVDSSSDPKKKIVRTVGPPFLSQSQLPPKPPAPAQ
jgi:hypothetical protein